MAVSNQTTDYRKLAVTLGTYGHSTPACVSISHGILKDAATISFERTLRVPDNQVVNNLPPSLGQFPLFSVADYKSRMPAEMASKGGIFLPMYQREAMWIKFSAKEPFAFKIYVGGVNAISGVSIKESPEAKLKRLRLSDKAKQDYIVLPDQPWLDGIASDDGRIRQFVAMPKGSGYSVEAQVTGEEKIDGMQFELIPVRRGCPMSLKVKVIEGASHYNPSSAKEKLLNLQEKRLNDMSSMLDLKKIIEEEFGLAVSDQELSLVIPNHAVTSNVNNDQLVLAEVWMPEFSILEVRAKVPLVEVTRRFACDSGPAPHSPSSAYGAMTQGGYAEPMHHAGVQPYMKCLSLWLTVDGEIADKIKYKVSKKATPYHFATTPPPPPPAASAPGPPAAPMVFKNSSSLQALEQVKDEYASSTLETTSRRRSSRAQGQAAPVQVKSMSLAAGGLIKQSINADAYPASIWDPESTILFNIQLLNSESFMAVTGRAPPATPIDAKTYQQHGYPFFDIWNEELSGIKGDFSIVKSVGEMDENLSKSGKDTFWGKLVSESVESEEFKRDEPLKFPVVMLDMSLKRTFKPVREMEEEAKMLKTTI